MSETSELANETANDSESSAKSYEFALENFCKLSESKIWQLLENYYKNSSISAWDQIPFYPTSNTFIAETYADIIFSFLFDIENELDYNKPLYILEMAAGTGCFSYYLLKELQKRKKFFSQFAALKICYIMADFTESNPKNWQQSPKLRQFVDEGWLKFAVFRPQADHELRELADPSISPAAAENQEALHLTPGSIGNPLIAIANYFFDSIIQDAFQIKNGKLNEVKVKFMSASDPSSWDDAKFEDLKVLEQYDEVSQNYFSDERLNNVLASYQGEFEQASILFPTGAFQCILNLLQLSENNLLLISSDKGFTDKTYVRGNRKQPFVAHHGVFSYSVNYDAIRRFFEGGGGLSFNTKDDNLSVSTSCNYLLKKSSKLDHSRFNFHEKVDRQNLSNYLYFMQDLLTEVEPQKSREIARAAMGYIRLCNYDPIVFCLAAPRIYFYLDELRRNPLQVKLLLEIIEHVRENFFSVQQQYDIFYWSGRLLYGLSQIDEALNAFADSLLTFGESSSALYYTAACYEIKKEFQTALRYYQDTLKVEPDCEYSQAGVKRIEALLTP